MQARIDAERKRVEEAKVASLEAKRRAQKEEAERVASENSRKVAAATVASKVAVEQSKGSGSDGLKTTQSTGSILKVTEGAVKLEERRLQIYKELAAENAALGLSSNKEFHSHGMQIARRIKTISGTKENVSSKAHDLIKLCLNSPIPQSISVALFAEKVVSFCVNPSGSFSNAAFAYARVIVLVTSQVPLAMDILLAELNKACIYTVPKYISYSESAFETKEAYYKAIGYQEEDGKLESTDSYVERLSSHMKLYGALVQTEFEGVQNQHGLKEGWAWCARFLNALPANLYTAVALHSFLEMAGFTLYRRYKIQFKKLLDIISRDFLSALRERGDPKLNKSIINIESYIESNQFLKEPEGWRLRSSLLSHTFVPE
ncbi:unnamed protein product [Ilex paraguariensis]|uniref:mRNA export factor GLE1 n=1 Tax=Ilex paraguariensis TaxID=185542 RepID=A0ABC8RHS4_9AQUA